MQRDKYGQLIYTENDICNLMLQDPTRTIKNMFVDKDITFTDMFINTDNLPNLIKYTISEQTIEHFDVANQSNWHMPIEYKNFDIAKFVLDQCKSLTEALI